MIWKFSSLKTVVGSRLLQMVLSGEKSSSLGVTESCKVSAELFHAAVLWCLCMLLIFPVNAVSHTALCCPTHIYVCLNSTVAHRQCSFLKLYWSSRSKGFQWSKEEVRAEFNFALENPLPLLEPLHAWVSGCPDSWSLFIFFCSSVLSCNHFRRLKPCVLMLAQRVLCKPPESVCMDSQIWGRLKTNAEQHRNVGSQKYIQTHFYSLSECPLWDRSWGFSRLMQTLFWCYSTEGRSLLPVLVCVTYTSCASASRHCLLNPAMN